MMNKKRVNILYSYFGGVLVVGGILCVNLYVTRGCTGEFMKTHEKSTSSDSYSGCPGDLTRVRNFFLTLSGPKCTQSLTYILKPYIVTLVVADLVSTK